MEEGSICPKPYTWREMLPLGQGLQFLKRKQWKLSSEEQRALDKIGSSSSIDDTSQQFELIAISWNANDDAENPRNWPQIYKIWVVFLISLYSFIVYCGSAIITPSYPSLMLRFGLSEDVVPLALSMYVLGYGVGPLLFSPLSEIPSIGRNPPYIVSFAIFLLMSIILGVIDNFPAIVVLRFLQGFFGSPCLATGGASITDVYSGSAISYGYTAWVVCIYCAPAFGPLFATPAVQSLGWHWPMWQIAIMAAPLLLLITLLLPETSHETILLRRARRLCRFTGRKNIIAPSELPQNNPSLPSHILNSLVRPAEIAIKDPAVGFVCLYCSFIYAIFYSFFEVFPLVYPYPGVYGMSSISYSAVFVSIVIGSGVGLILYVLYFRYKAEPLESMLADNRHEDALLPALPAACLATVGLFLFAWTARESIHWIVPTLGIVLYAGSTFVIYQAVLIYIPQTYPPYVASLLAVSDFTRSATAAVFIMVSPYMYRSLGIGRGVTVVASISVLGILGMFVLWRYGKQMRARSKFAVDRSFSDCRLSVSSLEQGTEK